MMNQINLKAWIVALAIALCSIANAENYAQSTQDLNANQTQDLSANPSDSNANPNTNYAESSDSNANPNNSTTTPSLRGEAEAIQLDSCVDCNDSTQSAESNNDKNNESIKITNDSNANPNTNQSQDSQDLSANPSDSNANLNTNPPQDSPSIFSTAPILGDSFGSFAVGYQMLSKRHSLSATNLSHSAFFALDRGWIFVDNALLFALSLDGSAGEFYSINIGAKLGYRALSGRIIPNIAISYGLINHKINDAQHNFHGATATLSLFVDIAQGFGLEVAYRVGLHPFPTLKKTSETANIHSFMVNLRFMDFGI